MAKQPVEVRDRFKITAEVEAASLGPLLAQLARMGLQNLGYELITDVVTYRRNGPKVVHEVQSREFASAWVADHPTFMISQLINHFRESGRTPSAGYAAVERLIKNGVLVRLEKGHYRRADVKAIGGPPPTKTASGRSIGGIELIREFIADRKTFDTKQIKALFEEHGREPLRAHQSLFQLVRTKEVKRVGKDGSGEYQVLKKVKPKKVSFADLNGSGAHATEQQHGS